MSSGSASRAAVMAEGEFSTTVAFARDVLRLVAAGIEAVTFGPGDIRDCHWPDDCVRVYAVVDGARAIRHDVRNLLLVPD